ncbi:alpha/beta fold hydrolase [Nocardia sp. NPDC049737]|uniref:alpha/beta hydrolase n=1 Tax=Nocardia sp. NPDC049737 TaxID=3154358 RepID=UPI00342BAB98
MQRLELSSVDGIRLDFAVHHCTVEPTLGVVLLVHGITVDMDEVGGMFVRLAQQLVLQGFDVVRFSFRGHGASGGTQQGVTIAGECLDLQAAVTAVRERFAGQRMSIVAASFGAVSTALSLSWLDDLYRLVLWNPVLDLRTFLVPELAWGEEISALPGRNIWPTTIFCSLTVSSSSVVSCSPSSRTTSRWMTSMPQTCRR